MRFWRSIVFYITLAISTVILGTAAIVVVMLTRRSDWAHLIGRAWAKVNLWAAGTSVFVNGLDNIRPMLHASMPPIIKADSTFLLSWENYPFNSAGWQKPNCSDFPSWVRP